MENTGKVDLSILNLFKKLRETINQIQAKWLENPNNDSFYFYQAARNVELILDRVEDRFKNSQIMKDNPKIAEDSLILFPTIKNILDIAESSTISRSSIDNMLRKIIDLRNKAVSTNLIEKPEANKELINTDTWKTNFTELMKTLDIPEDQEIIVAESEGSN
ncbi:hypothetical protein [Candidatus Nitrosotenuis aquarius]|uniref:hypothetical protein n=1 Tax=Candidatus Nitrosotenuis aquarius TaxID=1846278 RepID=UPI0013C35444|nr:hypothetical protein [Candidatus Nitrosotenuis aquarius]